MFQSFKADFGLTRYFEWWCAIIWQCQHEISFAWKTTKIHNWTAADRSGTFINNWSVHQTQVRGWARQTDQIMQTQSVQLSQNSRIWTISNCNPNTDTAAVVDDEFINWREQHWREEVVLTPPQEVISPLPVPASPCTSDNWPWCRWARHQGWLAQTAKSCVSLLPLVASLAGVSRCVAVGQSAAPGKRRRVLSFQNKILRVCWPPFALKVCQRREWKVTQEDIKEGDVGVSTRRRAELPGILPLVFIEVLCRLLVGHRKYTVLATYDALIIDRQPNECFPYFYNSDIPYWLCYWFTNTVSVSPNIQYRYMISWNQHITTKLYCDVLRDADVMINKTTPVMLRCQAVWWHHQA